MTMTAALPQPGRSVASRAGSPWAPGAQRRRATSLLVAGLMTTNAVAGLCALGFGLADGSRGLASALLAAAVVIVFFAVGQGVQVVVAEKDPTVVLAASLGSYVVRVSGLGLALKAALPYSETGAVDKVALMVTLLVCVGAWIGGEMVAYRRLRFPVYDTEYVAPTQTGEGS